MYKNNKYNFLLIFSLLIVLAVFIFFTLNIKIIEYENVFFNEVDTKIHGSHTNDFNKKHDFDIRLIQSPIIFALPTKIGFSKRLSDHEKKVDLFSVKSSEKEFFFKFNNDVSINSINPLFFDDINEYQFFYKPVVEYKKTDKIKNNLNYKLSKNLESILIDDSILLDNLASLKDESWFVKASLYVSKEGFVNHVFIDDMSNKTINKMSLMNSLYNIKFKSGVEEIGWIILNSISRE